MAVNPKGISRPDANASSEERQAAANMPPTGGGSGGPKVFGADEAAKLLGRDIPGVKVGPKGEPTIAPDADVEEVTRMLHERRVLDAKIRAKANSKRKQHTLQKITATMPYTEELEAQMLEQGAVWTGTHFQEV